MFVPVTADLKIPPDTNLTVERVKVPPVSVNRATSDRFFNSPAGRTQETKRVKNPILFIRDLMVHLTLSVASATTANSTHKM